MFATRRSWLLVVVAASSALLLSACGGAGDEEPGQGATVTETVTRAESPSPSDTEGTDDDGDGGDAGLPPRPARDECVDIDPPGNGRYQVYDAGRAVVRRDGGRLRVGDTAPASGWTARVTDRGGDDDVEIEFRPRGNGDVLELDVEIDDGRVEAQICADDRDD